MTLPEESTEKSEWELLKEKLRNELATLKEEIKEISLMVDQSQLDINRLTQRNATANAKLQQVQSQFDSIPRSDIRAAYDAALDGQQRLFILRGQFDKLQSDKSHLDRYYKTLEQIIRFMESIPVPGKKAKVTSQGGEIIEAVIRAQEAERQRLSRQIHDGPAQALSNFILQTEIAMRLFDINKEKAKEELAQLKEAAGSSFQKVRDFIFELRPMMLDDLGLVPTLTRYIDNLKTQTSMDIRFTPSGGDNRLEPYLEVMLFRAIQELLGNALRHSQGTQVKVQLDISPVEARASVDDNGKGFTPGMLTESAGTGLKVIRDRVEMIGGEMVIDSVVGRGSRISFTVPSRQLK